MAKLKKKKGGGENKSYKLQKYWRPKTSTTGENSLVCFVKKYNGY